MSEMKGDENYLRIILQWYMQVDVESTVGPEAFARLAPALPTVADAITVHSQFEALTASTGRRLPFPIYDKYVEKLDK